MTCTPKGLGVEQIRLIDRACAFLDARMKRGVDVAVDPECYLNSWANVPGNARLRCLASGWCAEPARLVAKMRDVAELLRLSGFEVASPCPGPGQSEFDHLIVSWARVEDFDARGTYSDRYLRLLSTDTPRALWFLISLDGVVPSQLAHNVRLYHRSARAQSEGLRYLGDWFKGNTRKHRVDRLGLEYCLSGTVAHAVLAAAVVGAQLRGGRFRQLVMPYEAQPFQHAMNLVAKAHDPDIKTVGYLHSSLPALPTDLICRLGAPDRLLVHGRGQAEILLRHLGWQEDRVGIIPSLRYRRGDAASLAGCILLPYSFDDADSILKSLEAFMRAAPAASMPRWSVRNHPVMTRSPKHLALTMRLQTLIERNSDRMSLDGRVSRQTLIIGATAAVVEALERDLDVVHICVTPLFEAHSAAIWTYMDVEDLGQNVYRYRLREPGSYIRLGEAQEAAGKYIGIYT